MIPRFQEDMSNNNQLFYMSTAAAGVMCILFFLYASQCEHSRRIYNHISVGFQLK